MNLRRRISNEPISLQLAPMIDVVMFLLCFFLLTWNLARYEQDLEIKVPTAKNGKDAQRLPGEIILNLRQDGTVELERQTISLPDLQQKLASLAKVYPDQVVVLRAAELLPSRDLVKVIDVCRAAQLTNISIATNKPEKPDA